MKTTRLALMLAALLTLSGVATAQSVVPAPGYGPPAAAAHHPRLYRLLEVVTEPAVLVNPSPYPGYVRSDHPLLDAAPNLFRLASLGLYASNSTALNWVTSFVPTGLRLLRVALYGLPFPATRGETALWVVSPNLFRMKRNREETGHLFNLPLLSRLAPSRPIFPRLYARRHGNVCECPR